MAPTADRDDRRPPSGQRAYRPDAAGGSRPRPVQAPSEPAAPAGRAAAGPPGRRHRPPSPWACEPSAPWRSGRSSGPVRPWSLDLGLSPPPPGRCEARGPGPRFADLGGRRAADDGTGNAP